MLGIAVSGYAAERAGFRSSRHVAARAIAPFGLCRAPRLDARLGHRPAFRYRSPRAGDADTRWAPAHGSGYIVFARVRRPRRSKYRLLCIPPRADLEDRV